MFFDHIKFYLKLSYKHDDILYSIIIVDNSNACYFIIIRCYVFYDIKLYLTYLKLY